MGGRRLSLNWIGAVPFLVYVAVFLLLPTSIITAGAFLKGDGSATLSNFQDLSRPYVISATVNSILLSALTAIVGASFGALLAYAIATGNPQGLLRRVVVSAAGVLAQFGGVTLAFAFLASIGPAGLVTILAKQYGINVYAGGFWIYDIRGLELVYLYFQIPLMVLVFLLARGCREPWWDHLALLAVRGRTAARAGVPGLHAASVRQFLLRVCDGKRADQPGRHHPAAADRQRPQQ